MNNVCNKTMTHNGSDANVVYLDHQMYLTNCKNKSHSSARAEENVKNNKKNNVLINGHKDRTNDLLQNDRASPVNTNHRPMRFVENGSVENYVRNENDSHSLANNAPLLIVTPKRPVVPVHPYKEKNLYAGGAPKISNGDYKEDYGGAVVASYLWIDDNHLNNNSNNFRQKADNEFGFAGTSPDRPPVPPKPYQKSVSTIKVPPQLPPKPFTLKKRLDSNAMNKSASEFDCLRESEYGLENSKRLRSKSNLSDAGSDNNFVQHENGQNKPSSAVAIAEKRSDTVDAQVGFALFQNNGKINENGGRILDVVDNSSNNGVKTFDLTSPGRRSVDFVSIVYDCSLKRDKTRRYCPVEDPVKSQGDLNGECFSGGFPAALEAVENEKKILLAKLNNKLVVLKKAYREIEQEIRYNESTGHRLESFVERSERLSGFDKQKYRLHVEDTEKLAHLFLKLSAQLARVENDLDRMPPTSSPKEKQRFTERRQRLLCQLTDAKNLKDDLDRRCESIVVMLNEIFTSDQMKEYENFLEMKTLLLVDALEIEENIALLEDRRKYLENNNSDNQLTEFRI